MSFLTKLFKRQESGQEEGQQAQAFSTQASPFFFSTAGEGVPTPGTNPLAAQSAAPSAPQQDAPGVPGASPQPGETPTLAAPAGEQEGPGSPGVVNLPQGSNEESADPSQAEEATAQEPEGEESSVSDDLMGLFEDAAEVDEGLQALLAHVEEVQVQELADDLRTFAEDVGVPSQ